MGEGPGQTSIVSDWLIELLFRHTAGSRRRCMDEPEEDKKVIRALDKDDIALLKTYGLGPYASRIKGAEQSLKDVAKRVNDICGIKESDTGLAAPSRWDLVADRQALQEEQPLQVSTCC